LLRVDDDHERRAWEIIVSFDDEDFSYTDATSFAVTESIGIEEAFSLDRHFREFGRLRVLPPPRP
jgi:predicted nucleic acid-binding protein